MLAKLYLIKGGSIPDIKSKIKLKFASSTAELEYFEVINKDTFEPLDVLTDNISTALCIAGYIENIRLLDNVLLNE